MSAATRVQVLSAFKKLNRAKNTVFGGDERALEAARNKILEEFTKHKDIQDPAKISELLKVAKESEDLLNTQVVQLSKVRKDIYSFKSEHLQEKCSHLNIRCDDCTCGR